MNVLLGAESLLVQRSGIGRMTLEIARQLRTHPQVAHLRLMIGGSLFPADALERVPTRSPSLLPQIPLALKRRLAPLPFISYARRRLTRARLEREAANLGRLGGGPVVYHEPNMIVTPFGGTTVATFNDLSWLHHPQSHPAERIAWIGRGLQRTLRQASRFVTISEFTAQGMAAELGVARERIDVVPLAPSELFAPVEREQAAPILERFELQDRRYILSVSTIEPRKNFDRLLAAWLRLPAPDQEAHPLVIVGGQGWGTVLANADAERARTGGRLKLLGHVADADLPALYARCAVFAYVSLYEGFGLPLVEAMAAGAPVIASSTTACGETAGDAALLVEPTDVDAIADALRAAIGDPAEADRLRGLGLRHAAGFSWPRTVELLLASWRRAAQPGRAAAPPLAAPSHMG
jgi:alpha-1,3-rhamnosyl/mannosyltransferase